MPKISFLLLTIFVGYSYVNAGWTRFSDPYEIYFSDEKTSWTEANTNCANKGMGLIKVDSPALTSIISANSNEWRWIGANDMESEGNWRWLDGTSAGKSSSYHNWNSITTEPNGGRAENCAVADLNGGWIDVACGRQLKYICQKTVYYTDLFQLAFSTDEKTWTQAKTFCERNAYRLIKIDSDSLTTLIRIKSSEDRWIGASYTDDVGQWKWLDGSSANDITRVYSNWNVGEPSNGTAGENCAIVNSDGKWKDTDCSLSKKFICQKDLPLSVTHNNHLYMFHRTERVDWNTANIACANRGSRLVEIYDSSTNNIIKNNIIKTGVQFFSGGNVNAGTKVTWDGGRRATYTAWATGEPNLTEETKIAMSTIGWNDIAPSAKLPYICEMANVTAITLPITHLTIGEGNVAQAICSADGVPLAIVSWNFSSVTVAVGGNVPTYQTKSDGKSVLHVENAVLTDEGTYTCIAENRAGNLGNTLSREFSLTVPSVPEYVIGEVQKCSPTINVRWRSNSRARNVSHKISIKNAENANETYEIRNLTTDEIVVDVKEWEMYNLTITPCPNDICKDNYALSNYTRSPTVGRPGKAPNLTVKLSSKYSCSITWHQPSDVSAEYVTNYKVIIGETFAYPDASGSTERISEFIVNKNQTAYAVEEKPNIRYNFGIQAQTCAGFGDVLWSNGSCVTDAKAPRNIEKPEASPNTGVDGTAEVTITVPSQENGKISCLFVIVQVHNDSVLDNDVASSNYTLNDLIRANSSTSTSEYIALALSYESVSTNNKVILGDGRITNCEISPSARRRKRSTSNNVFVGRNSKLDASKNNSAFVVTSSPARNDVLLKASESVRVIPATGNGQSSTGIIAGTVLGVIFFLILIVIGLLIFRRRTKKRMDIVEESHYAEIVENTRKENDPSNGEHTNPKHIVEDVVYCNSVVASAMRKHSDTDIPMNDFENVYNSMHSHDGVKFSEQFKELTRITALAKDISSNTQSQGNNEYETPISFVSTRVSNHHKEDGFIDACFIDGHEMKGKFITARNPMKETVNNFWMMVAEQNSTEIVMLGECVEGGKTKCEKYWPDLGGTMTFGEVKVSNLNETPSYGFVIRSLKVSANWKGESRGVVVSQFHFLRWPDHGLPIATSNFLQMHGKCIETWQGNRSQAPIVVHCSAGAERTGTFIGYDILLNESKSVGNADVFKCVAKMKRQRIEMVQTCDQYILIHKLLLESHLFGSTDVSGGDLLKTFSSTQYKNMVISEQFKNLSRVKSLDVSQRDTAEKLSTHDRMAVSLFERGHDIMKSLEASYVQTYDHSFSLLISKEPKKANVEVFWKLIHAEDVSTIVMITEQENEVFSYWNERSNFDVAVKHEKIVDTTTIRKLGIGRNGSASKAVTHIHLKLAGRGSNSQDITKINEFVRCVQVNLRESKGTALVHCKDGLGMSAVFCATLNLLDRLKAEDRVDVFRAVKDLRDCKKGLIQTVEQFRLCHEAVLQHRHNFEAYSNF